MKSYTLKTSGNSKIAAVYAKVCLPGNLGASFIENGFSQSAFTGFVAKVALAAAAKGMDAPALTALLESLAACNASQARQAMESLILVFPPEKEGDKPIETSVSKHWEGAGGAPVRAASLDLSLFGLSAEPPH